MKDAEIAKLKKKIEMLEYAMQGMAETFRKQIEDKVKEKLKAFMKYEWEKKNLC